jgi:hypothetical protein
MSNLNLGKFRQQLSEWIERRIESSNYPFRRVEATDDLRELTGFDIPGLILWINRDSLLAGGLILLPEHVDESALDIGRRMAAAIGLQNFVTWGARKVSLWQAMDQTCAEGQALTLPSARNVSPADFSKTLDDLLLTMKATCVDAALPAHRLPAEYFTNLCLIAIRDLEPELNESSRLAAGTLQPDTWTAQAPREKAWLSLWRLLMVLWHDRLAPGVQPERLEQALGYALADLCNNADNTLLPADSEPRLAESSAVRFHQLGGRMQQLGWTSDRERALKVIDLLLSGVAKVLALPQLSLPWPTGAVSLLYNVQRDQHRQGQGLIAPRIYLAGQCLRAQIAPENRPGFLAERLADIPLGQLQTGIIASLQDHSQPSRQEQEKRLIELRLVWPNRRFRLARSTPAWMWDALHLCGLKSAAGSLNLRLPANWPHANESKLLWEMVSGKGLSAIGRLADGSSVLQVSRERSDDKSIALFRPEGRYTLPAAILDGQPIGLVQICLQAPPEVLNLLLDNQLIPTGGNWPEWAHGMEKPIFLFLHTSLGKRLWEQASGQASPPELTKVSKEVAATGVPLPAPALLSKLESLDWQPGQTVPSEKNLDRKLALLRDLSDSLADEPSQPTEQRTNNRTRQSLKATICAEVFRDGVPLFPEHYLMKHYKPALHTYKLPGPLREAEAFFDRILLHGPEQTTLEVCGAGTAEALILASLTGRTAVDLPVDAELTELILKSYQQDLDRLWNDLTRECRRQIPRQKAALTLAKRIWRDQKLPPLSAFITPLETAGLA